MPWQALLHDGAEFSEFCALARAFWVLVYDVSKDASSLAVRCFAQMKNESGSKEEQKEARLSHSRSEGIDDGGVVVALQLQGEPYASGRR